MWHLCHPSLALSAIGRGSTSRTPGISGMGSFRLPGLAPAPGRRPPQPGCFGLGAIAATKILFQLIKFQVYGQADNSSITIVCCGAVSDCGSLIKITRLAVPSPARNHRRRRPSSYDRRRQLTACVAFRLTLTNFRSYRAAQIEVCAHRVVQNGRSHVGLRDEGRLAAPLCCFADQRSALAIA